MIDLEAPMSIIDNALKANRKYARGTIQGSGNAQLPKLRL
jgi:hypothetical protein